MSNENKRLCHVAATFPEGVTSESFEELIDEMKPFKTKITFEEPIVGHTEWYVILSFPPEFDDDFEKWTADQVDIFTGDISFHVRALMTRHGFGDRYLPYSWGRPSVGDDTAEKPEGTIVMSNGAGEFTALSLDSTQEEFEQALRDLGGLK